MSFSPQEADATPAPSVISPRPWNPIKALDLTGLLYTLFELTKKVPRIGFSVSSESSNWLKKKLIGISKLVYMIQTYWAAEEEHPSLPNNMLFQTITQLKLGHGYFLRRT
jgi:hypothetical protein